jgi:DNA-binding NarL/FixJ family response regulator
VTGGVVRVVIADDEPLVRSGIAMLLSDDPEIQVVAEAGDGLAAIEAVERNRPDVAVIDVRMPRMDGVEATRHIVERFPLTDGCEQPPVSVLILTTYNLDEAVYASLRAGASGFLLKDAAPNELLEAVKALARGEGWLDPSVTRALLKEFATRPDAGLPSAEALRLLTPRESEVLALMAHAMSNAQIAAHLVIGEGTVKTHVSRILMKLGLHDRVQAVVVAFRAGLVHPNDPLPSGG